MRQSSEHVIALIHGPDAPGIVSRVSGWIYHDEGNIVHADQHRDAEANVFFQRVEWDPGRKNPRDAAERFQRMVREDMGMEVQVALAGDRPRVAVMVSKLDHCFHDLLLRWKSGELPCEVVGVLSNHDDLREVTTRHYQLPFLHFPITTESKPQAEAKEAEWLIEQRVDLVVMARYMQVLSPEFLERIAVPVINIHHSFLPAFAGGRPYHQAYRRGVKLIGATAHYATADLDEGPIIAQDVTPVSHRHQVEDLVRLGRDLEKRVLARAVRWHLEHRILVYANKTVVFE